MDYVELRFAVTPKNPGSDILIAHLAELGFDSFTETETGFCAYISQRLYSEDLLENIDQFQNPEIQWSFDKKNIPSQNWNQEWEKNYEPIFVSNKCCVRAPFHDVSKNSIYDIVIEPKMSFGTGHHETTALMIESMLALDIKGKSVLDIGCGTGVLAILAAKMGAAKVVAIDIEEWAYNNALENVHRNNTTNIVVNKGDVTLIKDHFNIIIANINRNILLAELKKYCKLLSSKGILLISGFFISDYNDLSIEAEAHGLIRNNRLIKNNWVAAGFNKLS